MMDNAKQQDTGWVYLLKTSNSTFYKIGSGIDLHRRQRQIKLQLPFPVELQAAFYCTNFRQVERLLHSQLAAIRLNGEWFEYNMPVVFMTFLEAADSYSRPTDTYIDFEDEGWVSIDEYSRLYPIEDGWAGIEEVRYGA